MTQGTGPTLVSAVDPEGVSDPAAGLLSHNLGDPGGKTVEYGLKHTF